MKQQHWYSRSRSSSSATPREHHLPEANPGCMSMVHYLIFAPGAGCVGRPPPPPTSSSSSSYLHDVANSRNGNPTSSPYDKAEGLEAPRNSLELDADQLRDVQIGVQIEPAFDALLAGRHSRVTAPSSEAETPRTPSLVARLMGIDGLPEQPSPSPGLKKPRPSSSSSGSIKLEDRSTAVVAVKEKKKRVIPESMNNNRQPLRSLSCNVPAHAGEARSLPDTPRASTSSASARAAPTWDVLVDRPRLSLQVLKENVLDRAAQYMSMPTSPTSCSGAKKKNKDKDRHRRRDPKEHAREIVRQAKETVANRKSGGKKTTSTGSNKENAAPFVEDKLVQVVQLQVQAVAGKPAAPPPKAHTDEQHPHAPRLPPPQRAKPSRPPPPPPPPDHPTPSRVAVPPPPPPDHPTPSRVAVPPPPPQVVKCKSRPPDGCERFATRIKKPAAATTEQAPSAPPPAAARPVSSKDTASTSSRPLEEDPEYSYLRTVLERGGFMRTPPPHRPPFKGQSISSPVDPIVFHLLELELPTDDDPRLGPLRHRWNRKLLFHLAQEILADLLLLDCPSASSPARTERCHGQPLLAKVWSRVRGFPAADCRVVGDIDALVATDLVASRARALARHPAVAEEAGDVADDVAERVLDALLGECCCCCGAESLIRSSSSRAPPPR